MLNYWQVACSVGHKQSCVIQPLQYGQKKMPRWGRKFSKRNLESTGNCLKEWQVGNTRTYVFRTKISNSMTEPKSTGATLFSSWAFKFTGRLQFNGVLCTRYWAVGLSDGALKMLPEYVVPPVMNLTAVGSGGERKGKSVAVEYERGLSDRKPRAARMSRSGRHIRPGDLFFPPPFAAVLRTQP
jgi:hypothetical protein